MVFVLSKRVIEKGPHEGLCVIMQKRSGAMKRLI